MSYNPMIPPKELQEAFKRIRIEKHCLEELGWSWAEDGRVLVTRLEADGYVYRDAKTGEMVLDWKGVQDRLVDF